MLAASVLGIFAIPAVFYLVERWSAAARERFLKTQQPAITGGEQNA
jgi:HAE1 family hydrophobic/amphiphilic exporter-1